ncbi:hypothetical protein Tco_0668682 [Tanacetum coccineum]
MSSDLFFYTSSDDEDEVNSELAVFAEACQAAYEASKPKIHRTPVERDHYGAHDRLVMAYFSENPQYNEKTFRERFRMSRRLFTKFIREVTDASQFFQERYDCAGQRSISALMKCTYAVRQLAYGCVPDSLDKYLQMGATTAYDSLRIFCKEALIVQIGRERIAQLHSKLNFIEGEAICPDYFLEEQHRADDPVRTHAESMQFTQEIIDRTTHLSIKADLVEHIWNNAN